ncbi:MAG: SIR2 family protein [Acidobacteriia bacterium]|nr:SIR2 family protein [Terriglobia bacterium]
MSLNLNQRRTVYFLGAGASKSLCQQLPIGSELTLEKLCDPASYLDESDPLSKVIGDLREFAQKHPPVLRNKEGNIESAFADLEFRHSFQEGSLQKGWLVYCVVRRLQLPRDGDWCQAQIPQISKESLNKFLSFAKRENIPIITTNYDTLVERGLTWGRNSREVDYGAARLCTPHQGRDQASTRDDVRPLVLLKLHGSISWQHCPKQTCGYLVRGIYQGAAPNAMAGDDTCASCHGNLSAALIEPDYEKNYDDAAISEVLERAKQELDHAEIIVFAGYSLPDADKVIRCLLKTFT